MPLFIANQTRDGGEVQLAVRDWQMVANILLTRPRSRELPRRIMEEISGLDPNTFKRIRLSDAEIDRVDSVVSGG